MWTRSIGCILVLLLSLEQIVAPPASIKDKHAADKQKEHDINTNEIDDEMMNSPEFEFEYKRYLDEVVKTLETDEEFKKKVDDSNVNDINSGKIAKELEFVNHNIRSKLDELKRQEVQRLRDLIRKKEELGHGPIHPSEYEHIDHQNLETFEVKDLDNLIKKVAKDIKRVNELRKEQFKQYEMEKKFEDEIKMANMTDTEKAEYKHHLDEMKEKHANHERIHHPGSKAQMEEVWEKQDHLENQEFDPKIFFHLHDVDSNGYWDSDEVKALFVKELDKMYKAGLPEDDMRERQEEMERMTEHVFKEMDKNGDNLISFQEYMDETKSKEFNQDEGWETLDKQQIYSQQEYEQFEQRRVAQLREMMNQGLIPPEQYPGLYNLEHHRVPQYHPNQQVYHPNQVQHPNQQYMHQVPPQHQQVYQQHPSQQQYQPHPNQQHYPQQYQPQHPNQNNPQYQPQHPNQNNPQYQPQQPNQQYQPQQPNQNNQQYQPQQPNQNNQQYQPQQPNQNNQQYQPQQPNQNNQQYQQQQPNQNQQYQKQPNQNNQQYQQPPNQNNQVPNQNSQPNQNNQQHPSQNNQQHPNQNNQQHPNQNNQQHPNQNNQQHSNQNNQQYQPNSSNQNQPGKNNNPPAPARK